MNLSKGATGQKIPTAFETSRLSIRRYRTSDESLLFETARASIAEVFRFLPWCHPDYSIEDAREWLGAVEPNWADGTSFNFGIFAPDESELIGGCGINLIDEHPVGNLGYWIRSSSTRQGYAAEATLGLLEFAFTHLSMQRIEIIMSVENAASRAVAEAVGGQYEGRMRNRLLLHGKPHDAFLYSLTPNELHKK